VAGASRASTSTAVGQHRFGGQAHAVGAREQQQAAPGAGRFDHDAQQRFDQGRDFDGARDGLRGAQRRQQVDRIGSGQGAGRRDRQLAVELAFQVAHLAQGAPAREGGQRIARIGHGDLVEAARAVEAGRQFARQGLVLDEAPGPAGRDRRIVGAHRFHVASLDARHLGRHQQVAVVEIGGAMPGPAPQPFLLVLQQCRKLHLGFARGARVQRAQGQRMEEMVGRFIDRGQEEMLVGGGRAGGAQGFVVVAEREGGDLAHQVKARARRAEAGLVHQRQRLVGAEMLVVETARFAGGALQAQGQLLVAAQQLHQHVVVLLARERLAGTRAALHLGQRRAGLEGIPGRDMGRVAGMRQVARLLAGLEGLLEQRHAVGHVGAPGMDIGPVHESEAPDAARTGRARRHLHGQRGKGEGVGNRAQRHQQDGVARIGHAGGVGAAETQREIERLHGQQRIQFGAGRKYRGPHVGKQIVDDADLRVRAHRFAVQVRDRAPGHVARHRFAFGRQRRANARFGVREGDAEQVERIERHLAGVVETAPHLVQRQLHLRHPALFQAGAGMFGQQHEQVVGAFQVAAQVFAFGQRRMQREGGLVVVLPVGGRGDAGGLLEIMARRVVGHGGAGTGAGLAIEARQGAQFGRLHDGRARAVQVAGHAEQLLVLGFGPHGRHQQAADVQVALGQAGARDQGIGALLHPVVHEAVGARLAHDQAQARGRPQAFVGFLRRHARHQGDGIERGIVAHAGEQLDHLQGRVGQLLQARDHQVDHVVGEFLGADGRRVPLPAPAPVLEAQQAAFGQAGQELEREEGIAGALGEHQLGQRMAGGGRAIEGGGHQFGRVLARQRLQQHLAQARAAPAQRVPGAGQRMAGPHFAGAEGAHHQHAPQVGMAGQVRQQFQAGRIDPVQVVEDQQQHAVGAGQRLEELAEHQVQAALGFERRQGRRRIPGAGHEAQFGHQGDHQRGIRAEGGQQPVAPGRQRGLGLAQFLAHQLLEGAGQRGVGNVALLLFEFAGHHQRALLRGRQLERRQQGRLAGAGIARHQHQFRGGAVARGLQRLFQRRHLGRAADQDSGNLQARRAIVASQRERGDAAVRGQRGQAMLQVGHQAGRGLVALLGALGQQLHDDGGAGRVGAGMAFDGRRRRARHVAVDPLHGVERGERQVAGQQLVQDHPQRIQVAAGIDRAVHAAGLFRRHVGEAAADPAFGRVRQRAQALGDAEAGQAHVRAALRDQEVGRLQILVDDVAPVQFGQGQRDGGAQVQDLGQRQRFAGHQAQRRGAVVGQHQHAGALAARQRQRPGGPGAIEFGAQGIFVFEPRQGGLALVAGGQQQHGKAIGIARGAQQREVVVLAQRVRDTVACKSLNQSLLYDFSVIAVPGSGMPSMPSENGDGQNKYSGEQASGQASLPGGAGGCAGGCKRPPPQASCRFYVSFRLVRR